MRGYVPQRQTLHQARDVLLGEGFGCVEQADRRHHHARGAVAALERLDFEEGLLDRVEAIAVRERFDGRDRLANAPMRVTHERGLPVEENRARAALALAAPNSCPGRSLITRTESRLSAGSPSTSWTRSLMRSR